MVQGSDNSTKKYIKQLGSVSANGIEIMNAAQFSFESLGERIEVSINSDNAVFFDLIKKTNLRELDLSELDHVWTKAEFINSIGNTYEDGYIYGLHDSGYQTGFNSSLFCYGIVPSVFVKYIFQKIGLLFGYTFTGSIYNENFFENLVMPAVACNINSRSIDELKCNFITNTSVLLPNTGSGSAVYTFFDVVENTDGGVFVDKWNVNPFGFEYYLQIPGTYRVILSYDVNVSPISPGDTVSAGFKIKAQQTLNNEVSILAEETITFIFGGSYVGELILNVPFTAYVETTLNPNITGSENTFIILYLEYFSINSGAIHTNLQVNDLSFKIDGILNAQNSHFNRLFNIQANLPNWTCGKFIKEISNLFGIIPIVNEYTKEIKLILINELNENKPIAKDWQSKIDLSNEINYTFKIDGYGQKNKFEYSPNGDLFNYEIDILNESLPKEIEYVKSEFNYSTTTRILKKPFNTIFLDNYIASNDLDSEYTYTSALAFNNKPRIAFLFTKDTQLIYSSFGESNVIRNFDIPFLGFEEQSFQDFNFDWQYLYERFYKSLFNGVTDNILKIELTFRLTEFDIQDFDFSIPIYLENPSGFYYVQEIKDFTSSSESTSVELLRIG
jgi:hypothetical protein